jgi:8-amino-7-oxononanoate synthase
LISRDSDDSISLKLKGLSRYAEYYLNNNLYFYDQPITELKGGSRVIVNGKEMGMFASYSYLGLIGHPRINSAARDAIDRFGTGTHGVRLLAGTLPLHKELEETIAEFKGAEAAITFTSGYVTNSTVIAALTGEGDYIYSDTLNHASIVDGCRLSKANLVRFDHNDMDQLDALMAEAPAGSTRLVIADAVFSMDGDIIDLPGISELCRRHGAWLMIDEAHSIGVLGKTGRGIEEHFGMENMVDIRMGTLSKTIPATGGYIAGRKDLIFYLRHFCRGYIYSAALTPPQAGAALEAFRVILDEPWRVEKLRKNSDRFITGLKRRGFNTLNTTTAIVPIICGSDDDSLMITKEAHAGGVFVLPVVSNAGAVRNGLARLRATVTAAHEEEEIEHAMDVLYRAGKKTGILA